MSDDLAREIKNLERWHRDWEIRNRERLLTPTFATWDEVTHEHEWTWNDRILTKSGSLMDECDRCRIVRLHVSGTPTAMDRMHQALYELKQMGR